MAVQSDTSRIQYAGNNSTTTSYAVPFVFQENAHLKAIARTSAGVESVVTLTNHAGAGNVNGGTVRTAVAVPATSTLTIYREVPITQTTSYAEGGDFPAASHERALDKLTQIAQQLDRGLDRTIRFSEAASLNELPNPPSGKQIIVVENGALGWEQERQLPAYPSTAGTNALVTAGSGSTPSWQTMPSIATGPITATGSTTPRFISDRFADVINIKDYGAVGDGVTSDSAAIQAAFNACPSGGCVYFPPTPNGYRITSTLEFWQNSGVANRKRNITFLGHNTRLRLVHTNPTTTPPTVMVRVRNTPDMRFEGLHFDGGQPFVPFAQGATFAGSNFAYLGLLAFEHDTGFTAEERCNNCSVVQCTFTNARCFGIINGGHGGVGATNTFNDRFTVENCYFDNLDSAIVCNPAAPRRLLIQGCRLTNGQTRQFLDPTMWGGQRTTDHGSFFGTNINGVGIVLMADQNENAPNNALYFHRATSQQWVIANNVIDNWGHMGIETWGGNNITFSGNSISRVAYGISQAHSSGQNIACVGNVFRGNLNYDLEWGACSSAVVGNTFDGRAIVDNSTERSLCDYGIIAWHGGGLSANEPSLVNPSSVGNVFSNNVFMGHRRNNIKLNGGTNTIISGNMFGANRASSHISVEHGFTNLLIDSNTFVTKETETGYGSQSKTGSAIYVGAGSQAASVSSITRSGSTATVTASEHQYVAGDSIIIYGATQNEYNGTFTVLGTGLTANQFQITVSGTPASPATGTIQTMYNALPHVDIATLTCSGNVAEATCSAAHNMHEGQRINIWGANQSDYNGLMIVDQIVNSTTFRFVVANTPATPATGTIKVSTMPRLNSNGISITNNTVEGEYGAHAFLFTNDPSNSSTGRQSLTNVKVIGNHGASDFLFGGMFNIVNNGGGSFRNFYARDNTGGFASINRFWLRYNQNSVPTIHDSAPTWRPRYVGDVFFWQNANTLYVACNDGSSADWVVQTSNLVGAATYDPPSLNDGDASDTQLVVNGSSVGDYVVASFSRSLQGVMLTAWVAQAGLVVVRFQNETGGTVNLDSGTVRVSVTKS